LCANQEGILMAENEEARDKFRSFLIDMPKIINEIA
jgi:hypothetical protein